MSRLTAEATHWLRHHRGTITNQALADAGISTTQRERLVRNRILRRVIVGVYQFAGTDLDEAGRCTALCAGRAEMVISGPTAARHWGLRRAGNDGLVHAIAPPHANPCRVGWLRVFRTEVLEPADVVELPDGRRLTSPTVTVVLMTRHLGNRPRPAMAAEPADVWASALRHRPPRSPVGPRGRHPPRAPNARRCCERQPARRCRRRGRHRRETDQRSSAGRRLRGHHRHGHRGDRTSPCRRSHRREVNTTRSRCGW